MKMETTYCIDSNFETRNDLFDQDIINQAYYHYDHWGNQSLGLMKLAEKIPQSLINLELNFTSSILITELTHIKLVFNSCTLISDIGFSSILYTNTPN
jgi:hypothetical protein